MLNWKKYFFKKIIVSTFKSVSVMDLKNIGLVQLFSKGFKWKIDWISMQMNLKYDSKIEYHYKV